jgi:siroheme synthase-like protein
VGPWGVLGQPRWTPIPNNDTIGNSVPYTYPLLLDVSDRLTVIVGGGAVAARKARGLLKAGAKRIRMVATAFVSAIPAGVEKIEAAYVPAHLDGAGLIFAATDCADVNEAVVLEARKRGILVARADADDTEPGDFATPAHFREGPVMVSVSAGSAALATSIRDGLAERFDSRWAVMASLMQTLRPLVLKTVPNNADRRAKIFRSLTAERAIDLAAGGLPDVLAWLAEQYPEFKNA